MSQPIRRFDYIDAFRGYAILGVMIVHAAGAVPLANPTARILLEQGARGVQLFYVASAFTLMLSWSERGDGVLPFLIRRVFRIAPMFWAALLLYAAVDAMSGSPRSIVDILQTAFFVPTVFPALNANVVPSGWTVTCEVGFYAIFPILAILLRRWWLAIICAGLATYLSMKAFHIWDALLRPIATGGDAASFGVFLYFWLPNQLPIFVSGIAAFLCWQARPAPPKWVPTSALCVGVVGLFVIPFYVQQSHLLFYYGFAFSLIMYSVACGTGRWIAFRPMQALGRISFSAYLLHFLVITGLSAATGLGFNPLGLGQTGGDWRWIVLLALILGLTAPAAWFTYSYIERPFIRLGHRLADRVAKRLAARGLRADVSTV